MKEKIRQLEVNTIEDILPCINNSKKLFLQKDVIIEGGDIIIHNDIIFVGQNGNRTNKKGLEYLKSVFGKTHKIIPLYMINPNPYIPFVHLDCLFNPISFDVAIIYANGFKKESLNTIKNYFSELIYVSKKEQDELATNVISLGNNTVIAQKRHNKLINKLKALGFEIEMMDIYDTIKDTGYNRCLTCPLERKNVLTNQANKSKL